MSGATKDTYAVLALAGSVGTFNTGRWVRTTLAFTPAGDGTWLLRVSVDGEALFDGLQVALPSLFFLSVTGRGLYDHYIADVGLQCVGEPAPAPAPAPGPAPGVTWCGAAGVCARSCGDGCEATCGALGVAYASSSQCEAASDGAGECAAGDACCACSPP